jgi:uncharacterized protein (TIGR02145 family)
MREYKFWARIVSLLLLIILTSVSGCQKDDDDITEPEPVVLSKAGAGVTDIEGNFYTSVIIGNLEWMAKNLQTTRYNDSTSIQKAGDVYQPGSYSVYPALLVDDIQTENEMVSIYGLFYDGTAVLNTKGLCPSGWRVPTNAEWHSMEDFLIVNHKKINEESIGDALKSCRVFSLTPEGDCKVNQHPYWDRKTYINPDVANISGFNAVPAGTGNAYITIGARWWTKTFEKNEGVTVYVHYATGETQRGVNSITERFSVRCVKNAE